MMSEMNLPDVRAQLFARLAELEERGRKVEAEMVTPMNADSSEQAIEQEDDEVLAAEDAMILREITKIRMAIARVDNGSYGVCLSCGDEIEEARLAVMPEATLCTNCMQNRQH